MKITKKEKVLKELVFVNEYGVEYKKQLVEVYYKYSTGKEESKEFYLVQYVGGSQNFFRKFTKLGNANRLIEEINFFEE